MPYWVPSGNAPAASAGDGTGEPGPGQPGPAAAMDGQSLVMLQMFQQLQQQNQYLVSVMQTQQSQFIEFLERMERQRGVASGVGTQTPAAQTGPQPQTSTTPATSSSTAQGSQQTLFKAIDSKILPAMPVADPSKWTTRPGEILGFHSFLEHLISWIGMLSPEFGAEVKGVMEGKTSVDPAAMTHDQKQRATRLFYILKQSLEKSSRVSALVRLRETAQTDTNGYGLLCDVRKEYSLQTRTEALHFRSALLSYKVKASTSLKDVIHLLEAEWIALRKIFDTALDPNLVSDCLPTEPDWYKWLLGNLPTECRKYVQLHAISEKYDDAKKAILTYYEKTVLSEQDFGKASFSLSSFNVAALGEQSPRNSDKEETRECWYCNRKGHLAKDCRTKKKDIASGKYKSPRNRKRGFILQRWKRWKRETKESQ